MSELHERWVARLLDGCAGLRSHARGTSLARIAAAALTAVDPRRCVLANTRVLERDALLVGEHVLTLRPGARVWVFGAGKASVAMTEALLERFGDRIAGGLIIAKHLEPDVGRRQPVWAKGLGPIEVMLGDHPLPGPRSLAASARLRELARDVTPNDLVLCPISGGASALLSEPTIPLDEWTALVGHMLTHEVSIHAINLVRRRLDCLKAGGLARAFAPASVVGIVISDVVGDELALVGSGPTVYFDPARELARLADTSKQVLADAPANIRRLIEALPIPEPPPPEQRVNTVLLASNADAREAACRAAISEGLDSIVMLPAMTGPAAATGRRLAALLRELPDDLPLRPPLCLVTGGETLVDVHPTTEPLGRGGRNQELALAAVEPLAGAEGCSLLTLASDGEDGPTPAAGALVTTDTLARARSLGLDPADHLARHDSYTFFTALGDALVIGPTGTNVCDLAVLLRES